MFSRMFGERTLIVAYNAQFDLCFLYYFLAQFGMADVLRGAKMLDALTVYKDRRPFPHKLCNAVDAYQLKTQNTHRAIDDARATLELLAAMEQEEQDLERYVNLFGYNPGSACRSPRSTPFGIFRKVITAQESSTRTCNPRFYKIKSVRPYRISARFRGDS